MGDADTAGWPRRGVLAGLAGAAAATGGAALLGPNIAGAAPGLPAALQVTTEPSWTATPVDSSAQVQALIDAAWTAAAANGGSGGEVDLGLGLYYGSFRMRPGVSLRGQGYGTVLRAMPSQTAPVLDYHSFDAYHTNVSNLRVDGNAPGGAAVRGIDMTSSNNDAQQGPPLTNTATNDSPPFFSTWDNPNNTVDNVYVSNCAGDWAVYVGTNQRLANITRLSIEGCPGGGLLVRSTDATYHQVSVGGCSDGIVITGANNKFSDCKSWYHGVLAGYNKTSGPGGVAYFGDGFRFNAAWGKGSYGGNQLTACESQDNNRYGYALLAARGEVISGCMSGGDAAGAVYAGGPAATSQVAYCQVDVLVVKADRTQESAALVLDAASTFFNRLRVVLDVDQATNAGYAPLKLLNGATTLNNDIDLALGGRGYYSDGNVSGTYTPTMGRGEIVSLNVTGDLTIAAASGVVSQQRRLVFVLKQAATSTPAKVTWDASWVNAPHLTPVAGGFTVAEFVNVSSSAVPSWVCNSPTAPDAWHQIGTAGQPAFTNGWVSSTAGGVAPVSYRLRSDGLAVELSGGCANGPNATVAFTLPPGYRPSATRLIHCLCSGGIAYLWVATNGTVTIANISGSLSLVVTDGVTIPL